MSHKQERGRKGLAMPQLLLMIGLMVVAAGAGVFVGAKVLATKGASHAPTNNTDKGKAADSEKQNAKGAEAETSEASVIVDLGEFLVNLEGGDNHYLRAEVSVRLSGLEQRKKKKGHGGEGGDQGTAQLPAADLAVAKDCVTAVLSSGVFQELRTRAGREKLKQTVLNRLSQVLPQYQIKEVLFTSFVMQ